MVCVVVTLVHSAVANIWRPLGWDETVYVTQTFPGAEAIFFGAQRARGISVLVAPVAALGLDALWVRLWLAALVGLATWAAFRVWVPLVRWAAPVAAAGYSLTWFVLVAQSEIYPNALTALGVLATVGLGLRVADGVTRRRSLSVALLCAVALTTLMRPTDAVIACAALAVVLVAARARRAWSAVGVMLAGGLIGAVPWVVESVVRFGGVLERLSLIGDVTYGADVAGGPVWRQYLDLLDPGGPLQGPVADPRVSAYTIVFLVAVAVAAVAGWVAAVQRDAGRIAAASSGVAVALALAYLRGTDFTYLRFMLPACAAASPLLAMGLVWLWGRLRGAPSVPRLAGTAVVAATVAGWVAIQMLAVWTASAELADSRNDPVAIGRVIAERTAGRSCLVVSQYAWPQFAFYSGCDGDTLDVDDPDVAPAGPAQVFVLAKSDLPEDADVRTWPTWTVEDAEGWTVYEQPRG